MQSETIDHFVGNLQDGEVEVNLKAHNISIPVVQSLLELATVDNTVRRRDFACLVREERLLLVWAQSADRLLTHASDLEDKLVASVSFHFVYYPSRYPMLHDNVSTLLTHTPNPSHPHMHLYTYTPHMAILTSTDLRPTIHRPWHARGL